MKTKSFAVVLILAVLLTLLSTNVLLRQTLGGPGTWHVYPGQSIQAAINSAASGDTIIIHAGEYIEGPQLVVNKSLTIKGEDAATTVIKPAGDTGSSGDSRGWFLVIENITASFDSLTFDASGRNVYQAIRNKGQGNITNCIFKNIIYPTYYGFAAVIFGGNVDVINCTFSNIGRVGVLYFGSVVTNSLFSGNTYTGKGDGDWLDYGVEVGAGAHVIIDGNTFSGCTGVASVDNSTSASILVTTYYGAGSQATIIHNDISGSTYGIAVGYDSSDTSTVVAHENNIYANDYGLDTTAPTVDARFNWWGDASGPAHSSNPSGSGNAVSDNVDYSPWLGVTFETTPKTYHVNPTGTIQEAIDEAASGDTVLVHTGTYDEQVVISKSLTLQGSGDTTIVKPSSEAKLITILDGQWWGGGTKQIAGIIVANATGGNVIVKNLKVDGESIPTTPASADYVAGIFYRETGGEVDSVTVTNVRIGTSTAIRAYGLYLSAAANTVAVEVKGSTITNFDKNGIETVGTQLTANIHHNTIIGRSSLPSGDEVQNGVLISGGAQATVDYNQISDMVYAPETWWSCGILFYDASGSAQGNIITNVQIGLLVQDGNTVFQNNTVTGVDGKLGLYAQYTKSGTWTTSFTDNSVSDSDLCGIGATTYYDESSLIVTIDSNQLLGGPGDGIYIGDAPEYGPAGSITATITNNFVSGWQHGIHLLSSVATATITGNTIQNNFGVSSGIHIEPEVTVNDIHVNFNNIFGNTGTGIYGVFNGGIGTLDAKNNWWGDPTGPYNPMLNPSGKGDQISDGVNFEPWLINPYPPPTSVKALLYLNPQNVEYWTVSKGKTFTLDVELANVTSLYGYEFKIYWDTSLLDLTSVQITPPWSAYFIAKNETREDLGRYWLAVSAYLTPSFTGNTTLAKLTFSITYDPIYPDNKTCPIDLSDTKLSAPEGVPIYHMTHDGKYSIFSTRPKMAIAPATYTAHALGETFQINITISDVVDLYNFTFKLSYNTTQLDATNMQVGPFLKTPVYISKFVIDDATGQIWLWIWSTGGAPPASGSGVLATITFKVTKATLWKTTNPNILSCALDLHETKLWTNLNVEVPHDVLDGTYYYAPKPGDLDYDGHVGLTDFRIVAYYYDPAYDSIADINMDGKVDIFDLSIVGTHYGEDC